MSDVLAIIPARVGSKGIPNKNWRAFQDGRSPLDRAIATARCLLPREAVYVLTDAIGCRVYSAEVLSQPSPLHTDTCPMIDVVTDALARIPGPPEQIVVLLQPTQPLRTPKHITAAIALLEARKSHDGCVISVVPVESVDKLLTKVNWELMAANGGLLVERRQDARPTFKRDGTIYAWRRSSYLYARPWIALDIDPRETCPLDTMEDWANAERRLREFPA